MREEYKEGSRARIWRINEGKRKKEGKRERWSPQPRMNGVMSWRGSSHFFFFSVKTKKEGERKKDQRGERKGRERFLLAKLYFPRNYICKEKRRRRRRKVEMMITSMMMTVEMMRKKGTVKARGFFSSRERGEEKRIGETGEWEKDGREMD